MRFVLLLLLASSCTTTDHTVTGTYDTNYSDTVLVDGYSQSVVEITATDEYGYQVADDTFHSESVDGTFSFTVPDGSVDVLVNFQSKAANGSHVEYAIDGPVTADVDMGFIELL